MIKNNFILLLIIILGVVLISGCISTNKPDTPITDVNIYKGTDALEIEFLPESPPDEIYEEEIFQVVALLKNKGAYPINNGIVVLTYEDDYFESGKALEYFQLRGKDMYDYSDDKIIKDFYLESKKLEGMSTGHDSILLITACYDYKTILSTKICIDTDPHQIKEIKKTCETETESFSGQGSPISVKRIEPKMLSTPNGIKPQFRVYIKNNGRGEIISKDKINEICSSNKIEKSDLNGVILNDIRFSKYSKRNGDIKCVPKILKLVDGEDYFVCTLNEEYAIPSDLPAYLTDLYIEFDYGYTITKSKEFFIKKINT